MHFYGLPCSEESRALKLRSTYADIRFSSKDFSLALGGRDTICRIRTCVCLALVAFTNPHKERRDL